MSYEYVIIYVCRVYICCSDICIMIYIINMYLVLYIGQEYMCNVYMLEEYKPCRIKWFNICEIVNTFKGGALVGVLHVVYMVMYSLLRINLLKGGFSI